VSICCLAASELAAAAAEKEEDEEDQDDNEEEAVFTRDDGGADMLVMTQGCAWITLWRLKTWWTITAIPPPQPAPRESKLFVSSIRKCCLNSLPWIMLQFRSPSRWRRQGSCRNACGK